MHFFTRQDRGFTMIEVLIALVVISVGLLGLAGMQLVGLRSNSSASYRSQAAAIASDMAERMRANPAGMALGNFSAVNSDLVPIATPAPYCSDYKGGVASACGPAAMADFDINVVSNGDLYDAARVGGVKNLLPSGHMTIVSADGVTFDISVSWAEIDRDGTENTRDVTVTIR